MPLQLLGDVHGDDLLLELGVPVVLDVVARTARQLGGDGGPPAPDGVVEGQDDPVLLLRVAAVLDVRAQVVEPPQPAAVAQPIQPYPPSMATGHAPALHGSAVQLPAVPQRMM